MHRKFFFVPDANLGKWVETKLKGVEVITYKGNCPIHNNITVDNIFSMPEKNILVLKF